MRTLLRHTRTQLYFQGPDKWTNDAGKGYDFRFVDRALQYVETYELKNVELAFQFDDPGVTAVTAVSLDKTGMRYGR